MTNTKMQTNFERKKPWLPQWLEGHYLGHGAAVLCITLVALCAVASLNFDAEPPRRLLAGEIAAEDIVADHGFVVKDSSTTEARREQIRSMQPIVCDLLPEGFQALRHRVQAFFEDINAASTPEDRERVSVAFAEQTGEEIFPRSLQALSEPATQAMILHEVLPWVEQRFFGGIVADIRLLLGSQGGVIVRDARGLETLYTEPQTIPDLRMAQVELGIMLRAIPNTSMTTRRVVQQIVDLLIAPTLIPNYELTKIRAAEAMEAVEPTVYHVQKGEVIVRQGERVTPEQQFKLQALGQRQSDFFQHTYFIGMLCFASIIASGLFFSPSGKPSVSVSQKDLVFIALLVAAVALSSKALMMLGHSLVEISPTFSPDTLAYAMPLAGLAGLSAMLFSTRRYVTTGLLLAFFSAAMYKGSLALFLFYFLSAMWNTWLIVRTQSRQDVVGTIFPLLAGLYAMWAGTTFIQGGMHSGSPQEVVAVFAGGALSMCVVFALSPLMEMAFGYVTRFRLMELLNLDQPLLRELMINAPGTYHHSLIVSQLVESGAKAIDAHAMLCKVAALYHDVGKMSLPDYFIENQFGKENPHDKLAPSMSALILLSHVKKGAELAREHHLGSEVIDIIKQHHGTNLISYFFRKAQRLGENPVEADYCYAGPKPQTREAALVMLADIVEASSRTLDDLRPNRLQLHINSVIKNLFSSGQLDETDLTLKDMNRLSKSFLQVLVGLFHHRIKYPEKAAGKPGAER
jgi:putative nucleotidyltransferase with HDIG domain